MVFKINRNIGTTKGILYLLVLEIEDTVVYKVGMTTRDIEDRVAEILKDYFKKYRYFPKCTPKRFTKTEDVFGKEAMMHRILKEYKFKAVKKFDGSNELFSGIELDVLLELYKKCIDGEELNGKVCDGRTEDNSERA